MKRSLTHLPAAILLMLPWMTLAQNPIPQRPLPPPTANPAVNLSSPVPASPPGAPLSSSTPLFPKFDLDFPGGTPDLLVRMIAEATRHPLNVIIPEDLAITSIPAIKLRNVTVPQVFAALSQASRREVARINGYNPGMPGGAPSPIYQIHTTSYGFFTQGDQNPDSVWYFKAERPAIIPDPVPPVRPKVCRFFQLGPYLDEYKVEDITTAVETAWTMLGKTNEDQPEMKFHKDTKLLIVVGSEGKVAMIDSVLQSLTRSPVAIDPATGLPVPGARPGKLPPHIGQPLRQ
jgi:hypothetical protein